MLKTAFNNLVHLFYPKICAGCSKAMFTNENIVCTICEAKLPRTNFHTFTENPIEKIFWGRVNIKRAAAFLFYEKDSLSKQLIGRLKYNSRQDVGVFLGELYGENLKQTEFNQIDFIVPVPLHFKKLKTRGYNQCDAIAKGLANSLKKPILLHCLQRVTDNTTQTGKNRVDRWESVEEIFSVKSPEKMVGKHLLLVDDVVTTGATLEACAIAIGKIEKTKISIVTLACAY